MNAPLPKQMNLSGVDAARRWVELIAGTPDISMSWRLIRQAAPKDARDMFGTLDDLLPELQAANADSFGVFIVVNDGGGNTDSITRVRAVFIDSDGVPLSETRFLVQPHFIVRRTEERWHAFWLVADVPLDRFTEIQKRLARHYNTDKSVTDLPRVMRVPGFLHTKDPANPEAVDLWDFTNDATDWEVDRLSLAAMTEGLPDLPVETAPQGKASAAKGLPLTEERFREILSFVDPTFAEDQNTWAGLAKCIRHGQLPLVNHDAVDFEELLDDWCSGELWRKRTGDSNFVVPTYQGVEELLQRTRDKPRQTGAIGVGSFIKLAREAGYKGASESSMDKFELMHGGEVDEGASGLAVVDVPGVRDHPLKGDITGEPSFQVNKFHKPTNNLNNAVVAALHLRARPELDEFKKQVTFRGEVFWNPKELGRVYNDEIARTIRFQWLAEHNFEASKDNVDEGVKTVATHNRFHPVRDYLSGLTWDGIPRLDSWLTVYCGVENSDYARAVGRKTLIAAVTRVMRPGCKFDTMLLFVGPQGAGKSSAFRILAGNDWFTDSMPPDLSKADAVAGLQGRWIIEMSELESLSRSEVATVKAFLSRQEDNARLAYGRNVETFPRQCIVVGTTNDESALKDATGARRFWPVTVTAVDFAGLAEARGQLWAEAVVGYRARESLVLPRELWRMAAEHQEQNRSVDPWEDKVREIIFARGENVRKLHSRDILEAIGISYAAADTRHWTRLKTIMVKRLGWHYRPSVKIGGIVSTGYLAP